MLTGGRAIVSTSLPFLRHPRGISAVGQSAFNSPAVGSAAVTPRSLRWASPPSTAHAVGQSAFNSPHRAYFSLEVPADGGLVAGCGFDP